MSAILDIVLEGTRQAIESKSLAQLDNRNEPGGLGQFVGYMSQLMPFLVRRLFTVRRDAPPALPFVNVVRRRVYIAS